MKLVSRFIIALALCFIALPALTIPVQALEPTIDLSDTSGYVGDEILVYGEGFTDYVDDYLYIRYQVNDSYETMDTVYVDSDGSFESDEFTIPESCKGGHEIGVDDYEGDTPFVYETFTVNPMLKVTSPSDAEGLVGTQVTIKGTGFGEVEDYIEVRYYTTSSDFTVVRSGITANDYGTFTATFNVPSSSRGEHEILAKGEDTDEDEVNEATFTVESGISLSNSSGYVGDSITVTGNGFDASEIGISVTYDGSQVGLGTSADAYGAWTVTFDVPASAKGGHKIDAYGSYTSAADIAEKEFTISQKATLTPTEGYVGISLSVSGTAFAANQGVSIKYDGTQVATATSDNKGSFSATFLAPKSIHGNHTVTASDVSGNSVSFNFVMESTPPAKPTLSLPANGSRVGFIGKVAPKFEWSAVTDPSGVAYTWQIATDAGFVNLVVPEISGLTEASYVLPKEQALPYGRYYWRVKAIDGAENDSGWTIPYSFKAGLLPLWAFITIVALLAVLIGVLVYFFAIRKKPKKEVTL